MSVLVYPRGAFLALVCSAFTVYVLWKTWCSFIWISQICTFPMKPTYLSSFGELTACISDIKFWIAQNFSKFNHDNNNMIHANGWSIRYFEFELDFIFQSCWLYSVLQCSLICVQFADLSLSLPPQGPFVHVASLCAALLSKFMAAVFGGIYMVMKVNMIRNNQHWIQICV